MKKVLLGLAALAVLLIAGVVVAPSFIDWTSYRNGIAAEIERVLNRRVVIDGAVEAAIVPTPRLSLHNARLGNVQGASSPTMAQAEALEVRVAFWPLLSGRIVVTSVVLRKPVIELEVLADGRRNWIFTGPSVNRPRANAMVNPTEGLPDGVQFENAVITDGTIVYRDERSGVEERVEGLNARFAAGGLNGPLRAAGELRYGALPLRFSLATGRLDPRGQGTTPLNLSAEIPGERRGQPARGAGSFTGNFRLPEIGPQLSGQLKLQGEDLAGFVAALGAGDDVPFGLAQAFSVEGSLELKDDVLNGNDLAVQLGETRAQGAVSASFTSDAPQFDVALSVGRIDLDAWFAAAAKKKAEQAQRDSAAPSKPEEFILPVGLRVTLDVAADALTYRGGAMRQVKLAGEMSEGVIDIHQLAMQLPGGSDGLFTGKLFAAEGKPRLDGFTEVASDDFRSLLAWLDMDVSDLPAGRLNKISATSHVGWTGEMLDLSDLDLRFDNTRMTGALVAALRERPALGINLVVDQLNLDSYMPAGEQASPAGAIAFPFETLVDFDANVRLRVGQLVVGAAEARGINLDGTLLNGVLTMRKLAVANLAGGATNIDGTLQGFDDKVQMNLQFDVEAEEPMTLLRAVGLPLPVPEAALKPLSASGKISGSSAGYKINGVVNAAVTSLTVVGDLAMPPQGPSRFAFDLSLDHPNYVTLVRLFDPDFSPEREPQAQAVSLNAKLEHSGKDYKLSAIGGVFGPLPIEGNVAVALNSGLPRVDAQLTTGDIDTRHFLAAAEKPRPAGGNRAPTARWSSTPIDLGLTRIFSGTLNIGGKSLRHGEWTIAEPRSEITLGGGGIALRQLSGQMLGGKLAVQGKFAPSDASEAAMALDYTVSLTGAELGSSLFDGANIDLSGGRFDLSLEGAAVGSSEAALIAGMSGKGSFTAKDTTLKGFDLARLNSRFASTRTPGELARLIQSSMSSGTTKVEDLRGDFTINDGIIGVDDLVIRSAAGEARVLVAADLPQWRLDATAEVHLASNTNGPSFGMQLGGPLDAPKRDFDTDAFETFMLEESVRRGPAQSSPAPQREQPAAPQTQQRQPTVSIPAPQRERPAAPQTQQRQPAVSIPAPQREPAPPRAAPPVPSASLDAPAREVPAHAGQSQSPARTLNVSPNASGTITPQSGSQGPTPRVLNVSPNAPGAPSSNAPRVLSISPNAPGAPPSSGGQSPQNAPRVISISPNAAPTTPSNAQPQSSNPDSESFARDILRGLDGQP